MAIEEQMETLVDRLLLDYDHGRDIDQMELFRNPDRDVVIGVLEKLRRILFPGYFRDRNYRFYNLKYNLSVLIEDVMFQLTRQVSLVFQRQGEKPDQAEQHAQQVAPLAVSVEGQELCAGKRRCSCLGFAFNCHFRSPFLR